MSTKSYPIIGTKSSILWDEETDAWSYISGKPERSETPRAYYRVVPTLYRAVDMRAKAVSNLPWALMKGETEYDSSENFENKTGLVASVTSMLWLIEASLSLMGAAYWKRETNPAGFDKLRHLDPASLELDEKKAQNGEIVWKRNENGVPKPYTPKEIIYFWYPDPFVEIGPPSASPAGTALAASGVLANIDEFAKAYFARGAVKATVFAMQGASKQTADEFETWWKKFISGLKNVFSTKVINAEHVEPVVIGEGIKELADVTVAQEKREEIAIAMDIKQSLLFADAANFATANQDKLNWYDNFVVPEAKWIADILNEQLYEPLGLRFEFRPETLDIYQEDEEQRAASMSSFIDALVKADTIEMAKAMFDIFGYEISDEAMGLIEKHFAGKEERASQMQEQLQQGQIPQTKPTEPPEPPEVEAEEVDREPVKDLSQLQRELTLWRDKCLAALKKGETAASVDFLPITIPGNLYSRIMLGLKGAANNDDVRGAFTSAVFDNSQNTVKTELARWANYAIDNAGKEVEPFKADAVLPVMQAAIIGSLAGVDDVIVIKSIFENAMLWSEYP